MRSKIKTIIISIIVAFGSAFAIMSFNEDVAIDKLFQKIYELIDGSKHTGFGVLECTYGIGIVLGITFFFNSFPGKKNNTEPTPIELKMQQYDEDVQKYLKNKKK